MAALKLVSKEGQMFNISKDAAIRSNLIKNMLEDAGPEEDIPLPNISTNILEMVIEYLNHYQDPAVNPPEIEKPLKTANFSELVPAWDNTFVEKPHEVLFELILAANYLDIKGLLDLSAAKVASMIKGKTPEEIRRTFNIVNDFTPEEEAQIPIDGSHIMSLKEDFELRDAVCAGPEEYWKVKAQCLALGLSCLGLREELIHRLDIFTFHSDAASPNQDEIDRHSDVALEKVASSSWLTQRLTLSSTSHPDETYPASKGLAPWKIVPELSYMNKKICSTDIMKAVGLLMRPTFCFYNHVSDGPLVDRLLGVAFLPFTPQFLSKVPEDYVRVFAGFFGLTSTVDSRELQQAIERQKLLEIAYAVLDSEALHGVTYCQTRFSVCKAPASALCSNFMCHSCCGLHQVRDPCRIHDSLAQFLRFSLHAVCEFEDAHPFERTSTMRLQLKATVRKVQLYRLFEGYSVVSIMQRWDKIEVAYDPYLHKLQHVYITFATPQEATRAYTNRHELATRADLQLSMAYLNEPLQQLAQRCLARGLALDCTLLIMVPSVSAAKQLPDKTQIILETVRMAAALSGVPEAAIRAEPALNPLTGKVSVREFLLEFPSAAAADAAYLGQPYFQVLVAHKLSHLLPFPFLRPAPSMCLMCTGTRSCIHDMCAGCCPRMKAHPLYSCTEHGKRTPLAVPEQSFQNRRLLELSAPDIVRKLPEKVGTFHMLIRHLLEEGVYTWYRPRFYLDLDSMRLANQELQVVLDSSTPRTNVTAAPNKKEGKLFNYISSSPTVSSLGACVLTEAIDNTGHVFLEYNYNQQQEPDWTHNYGKADGSSSVYTRSDYEDDTCHVGYKIRTSFHFFLAGLDPYRRGLKEIIVEEIRKKLGAVLLEEIILIDKDSLLANMILMDPNAETKVEQFERIVCVKLRNETDAFKLLLGEVTLTLPLSNGHLGSPIVIPSADLCQFIHSQYEEHMRNPTASIQRESINPDKITPSSGGFKSKK